MKKIIIVIILSLALLASLAACSLKKGRENDKNNTCQALEEQFSPPTISGPISIFPWEEQEDFLLAKEEQKTDKLLAGYATVLKDPLPGEEYNVHLAASYLKGITLKAGKTFSQNASIGPYIEAKGYQKGPTYINSQVTTTIGGGVCKISSTLYNVAILSNLEIVERHNHGMPVPYVPYGQDATVAYGVKDFKFRNNSSSPLLIWALGIDNILYMAFYGQEEAPLVEWQHEILETKKAPIEYKINPSLRASEINIINEGMDGAKIKSYALISYEDGSKEKKYLGISSYRPMTHIHEVSGSS